MKLSRKGGTRSVRVRDRAHLTEATPVDVHNPDLLDRVLDCSALGHVVNSFTALGYTVGPMPKSSYANPGRDITSIVTDIATLCQRQMLLSGWLNYIPLQIDHSPLIHQSQEPSMRLTFTLLQESTRLIPRLQTTGLALNTIAALCRWVHARCLEVVLQFTMVDLPLLVQLLFDAAEIDDDDDDFSLIHAKEYDFASGSQRQWGSHLSRSYPTYAPLVRHIIRYTHLDRQLGKLLIREKERKTKKRRGPDPVELEKQVTELRSIPWDLYGLRQSPANSTVPSSIQLPKSSRAESTWDGLRECAEGILIDLIERELVFASVSEADIYFNPKSTQKYDWPTVRARTIPRALILRELADACGSEAIFFAPAVEDLLRSPALVFSNHSIESTSLIKGLKKDPVGILAPLRQYLQTKVTDDIREIIHDLGEVCQQHILQYFSKSHITYQKYIDPQSGLRDGRPTATTANQGRALCYGHRGDGPALDLTLEALLRDGEAPHFGGIALIYREALNHRRGMAAGRSELRQFLEGQKPGEGSSPRTRDVDQVTPFRADNIGTILFLMKLPSWKLISRMGLSNALIWMLTGQGNRTVGFLHRSNSDGPGRPDTFFSETLVDALNTFGSALRHNLTIISQCNLPDTDSVDPDDESPPPKLRDMGMVQISNCTVYGSACNLLKLLPTKSAKDCAFEPLDYSSPFHDPSKFSLMQKFSPYFAPFVCDQWEEFIGRDRRTWTDGMRLFESLGINGIKTGLVKFQATNNLSYAGICEMPTIDEIATWIWDHPELGAHRGLVHCGFRLENREFVRAALTIVQDHLDFFTSTEDLAIMKSGPASTEQVLCKDVRWLKRMPVMQEWIAEAEKEFGHVWTHPDGMRSSSTFPFPVRGDLGRIEHILTEIKVCTDS